MCQLLTELAEHVRKRHCLLEGAVSSAVPWQIAGEAEDEIGLDVVGTNCVPRCDRLRFVIK